MPGAALPELLARLGAAPGHALVVTADELERWPPDVVAALKAHAVLRPGKPSDTALCPGCERACVMPVQQRMRPGQPAAAFIVCDRRDDIGQVRLAPSHLERWRADGQTLGDALAALLGSGACHAVAGVRPAFRVGMVSGKVSGVVPVAADKVPVQLQFDDQGRALLDVAGHLLELEAVLTMQGGRMALDTRRLGRCADAPATGSAQAPETATQRAARLLARKAALQQRGVKAFLQVLAEEERVSVSMVKRILGRAAPADDAPLPGWAAPVAPRGGVSPTAKTRR